jgi:hypothetical protein
LLAIALLVAMLAAILHWLLMPEKTGSIERIPSTFFNVPSGAKAGYEVLQRLDFRAKRLRRRISPETLKGIGVLFVLRPKIGLAKEELAALKEWIDQGHALVVVPGEAPTFASKAALPGDDNYLDDWFAWNDVDNDNSRLQPIRLAERAGEPSKPEDKSPLSEGLHQLSMLRDRRFASTKAFHGNNDQATSGKVFWKDEWGVIGIEACSGKGAIVALADEYPFSNVGISEADNGVLLANVTRVLSVKYPGDIAFDEYHLGMADRDVSAVAIAKLMLAGPWRWAFMQAALVGVLALFAKAVRFGKPQDVVRKLRRQHREFAEAAGRLFEEAGAASLAAETLYRYYRDRLCKRLYVDTQVEDAQLCEAVERRAGRAAADSLRGAHAVLEGPISRQQLLKLTHELHRVTEGIEHGT